MLFRSNILSERATWYISFIPEKSTLEFIQGIFAHQSFTIGNKEYQVAFDVVGVEVMPMPPLHEEMAFQALSPICVKQHEDNKIQYLSPDNPKFVQGILKGLLARFESIHGQPFDMEDKEFSFGLIDKQSHLHHQYKKPSPWPESQNHHAFRHGQGSLHPCRHIDRHRGP